MEKGAVFNPSYKSFHRDMVRRKNECTKALASLKNPDSVYANEIRRCQRMYERVVGAIEIDKP